MSKEWTPLTEEQVRIAQEVGQRNHSVVNVIEECREQILLINSKFPAGDFYAENGFVETKYQFLNDLLLGLAPFTLDPEDIVAIGAKALPIFQKSAQRQKFAEMVVNAYCEPEDLSLLDGLFCKSANLAYAGESVAHLYRYIFDENKPKERASNEGLEWTAYFFNYAVGKLTTQTKRIIDEYSYLLN